MLARRYGEIDKDLIEFIEKGLQGHYRLAVLSNMGSATAEAMLGEYAGLFDEVMISGELGVAKPDPRAYLLAAKRLGEFPEDCLMIDDNEVNCYNAKDIGMSTIVYRDPVQLRRELANYGILTP